MTRQTWCSVNAELDREMVFTPAAKCCSGIKYDTASVFKPQMLPFSWHWLSQRGVFLFRRLNTKTKCCFLFGLALFVCPSPALFVSLAEAGWDGSRVHADVHLFLFLCFFISLPVCVCEGIDTAEENELCILSFVCVEDCCSTHKRDVRFRSRIFSGW